MDRCSRCDHHEAAEYHEGDESVEFAHGAPPGIEPGALLAEGQSSDQCASPTTAAGWGGAGPGRGRQQAAFPRCVRAGG